LWSGKTCGRLDHDHGVLRIRYIAAVLNLRQILHGVLALLVLVSAWTAQAGPHVMPESPAHVAVAVAAVASDLPCHGTTHAAEQPEQAASERCCDDGQCGCDCVHAVPALLTAEQLPGQTSPPVSALHYVPHARQLATAQPALRPPIG